MRVFAGLVIVAILAAGAMSWRAFTDDGSGSGWLHESGSAWNAERALVTVFDRGRPNVTIVVEASSGDVDGRAVEQAARRLTVEAEERGLLTQVESYWSLGRPDWLRSDDGTSALILARIPGESIDLAGRAGQLARALAPASDAISVRLGGEAMVHRDIAGTMTQQLGSVLLAALAALLLTLAITRNLQAVALVGLAAAVAVAVTLSGLRLLERFVDIPTLAVVLGIASAAGLTLSGGHLMARRYLAEQSLGADRRQAVAATVATAGRNVAMGAAVTGVAGVVMWFLPTTLLRSSGYAMAMGAVVAGLVAVAVLGLVLALVAPSPQQMRPEDWRPARLDRLSSAAMRRPVIVSGVTILGLVAILVFGFVQSPLGTPGPETLAAGSSSRAVAQELAAEYSSDEAGAPFIIGRGIVALSQVERQAAAYAAELSEIPGVARVDAAQGSFAQGVEVDAPTQVRSQHRSAAGLWLKVPVEGSATGRAAVNVIDTVDDIPAPFRVQVGGLAARQVDTTTAVEARFPIFMLLALAGIALVVAGLLRSLNAAIRATLSMAAIGGLAGGVVRWGFADGVLAGPLGFVGTGTVDAVGPPLAWAVGLSVAGVAMSYGWSALREMNDASQGAPWSAGRALAATRGRHLEATAMMAIPFAPLVFAGWRPAQLVGVVALTTGVAAGTLGRFVLLPAMAGFRQQRLWPVDARGDQRKVFPTTAYGHAVVRELPVESDTLKDTEDTPEHPEVQQLDDAEPTATVSAPAAAPRRRRRGRKSEAVVPVDPMVEDEPAGPESEQPVAPADAGAPPVPSRKRRRTASPSVDVGPSHVEDAPSERSDDAEADGNLTGPEPQPQIDVTPDVAVPAPLKVRKRRGPEGAPQQDRSPTVPVVAEASATDPGDDDTASDVVAGIGSAEAEVTDETNAIPATGAEAASLDEPSNVPDQSAAAKPEPSTSKNRPSSTPRRRSTPAEPTAPAVSAVVDQEPIIESPATTATPTSARPSAAPDIPVDDETTVMPAAVVAPRDPMPVAAVPSPPLQNRRRPPRQTSRPSGTDDRPSADGGAPRGSDPQLRLAADAAAVDVVSLTESVIASLDADTPFTTEVGSGYVANPSNNLSRVMEAILRDASERGGEEVLVYGHAARGRYRWMVVDSGPDADRDPDRARTLAEAQRFIRRVGGVVECRPEGEFTVFVVEIPMAS